jgi:hypothetical protein
MSLRIYARLSRFAIILSDKFDKYLSLQICKCAPLTQATSITSVSQPSPKCQTWASASGRVRRKGRPAIEAGEREEARVGASDFRAQALTSVGEGTGNRCAIGTVNRAGPIARSITWPKAVTLPLLASPSR